MPCSRCGQNNRAPRPAPSIVQRPGAGSINPSRPVASASGNGLPSNVIKSAITGLRYVPTK